MPSSKCAHPSVLSSKPVSKSGDSSCGSGSAWGVVGSAVLVEGVEGSRKRDCRKESIVRGGEKGIRNTSNSVTNTGKRYSTYGVQDRPLKRRRLWYETVTCRALANGVETDAHRISQRQKQIEFGKNTPAYDRFNKVCPRKHRRFGDPMTPLPHQKCSKRSFAGQITSWKKRVYEYVAKLDGNENERKDDQQGKDCAATNVTETKESSSVSKDDSCTKQPVTGEKEPQNSTDQPSTKLPEHEPFTAPSSAATTSVEASADEATRDEPHSRGDGADVDMMDVDMFSDYSDMEGIELDDQGNVITRNKADNNATESEKSVTQTLVDSHGDASEDEDWSVFKPF